MVISRTMVFPSELYDRSSIALGNMASGDMGAAMTALISPMKLSPAEIKSIRSAFMPNEAAKKNPIMATAMDLATNPMIIIGLAMMLGPWGKIANPKQLNALLKEGKGFIKGSSPFLRGLFSDFTNYRNLWYKKDFLQLLGQQTNETILVQSKLEAKFDDLVAVMGQKLGRKLLKEDFMAIESYARGFNKTDNIFSVKYGDILGTKVPLMPKLQAKLGPVRLEAARKLKALYAEVDGLMTKGPGFAEHGGSAMHEMELKGFLMRSGTTGSDYFPARATIKSKAQEWLKLSSAELRRRYRETLNVALEGRTAGRSAATKGYSIPLQADLEMMKDYFDPVQYKKLLSIEPTNIENARKGLTNLTDDMIKFYGRKVMPKPISAKVKARVASQLKVVDQKIDAIRNIGVEHHMRDVGSLTPGRTISALNKAKLRALAAERDTIRSALRTPGGTVEEIGAGFEEVIEGIMKHLHVFESKSEIRSKLVKELAEAAKYRPKDIKGLVDLLSVEVGSVPRFGLRADVTMPRLFKAVSPTHHWWIKGYGPTMTNIVKTGDKWQQTMWGDYTAAMMRGMMNPKEFARNQFFRSTTRAAQEFLIQPGKAQNLIPSSTKQWMIDALGGSTGKLSATTFGGALASRMYASTLAMNMSPVSKNLLQNYITTLPIVGGKSMMKGMSRVTGGLGKLANWRNVRMPGTGELAKSFEEAFTVVFPEYTGQFPSERIAQAMMTGDIAKEGQILGKLGGIRKIEKLMMMPFAGSEKFNRLLAFYSSHDWATKGGLAAADAAGMAGQLTRLTQFYGGTLGVPKWLRGVSAPARQFMHFPMRYLEFLYNSSRMMHPGGPLGEGARGITTGIMGRTMVGSAGLYTVAKNLLNTDVSGGLAFAALPFPQYESSPFYPFPLVPPAISAVGDVAKSVMTGNYEGLGGRMAGIALPGGLAARRAYRTFAPKYAGYKQRSAEGKIPVYNKDGALISEQTPMQLVLRGMGIHNADVEQERKMMQYLLGQREMLRKYRRVWIHELANNNMEKAAKISKEFSEKYPELGKLKVRKSDIRAYRDRRHINRIQRVLKGFPKEYKPLFSEFAGQAIHSKIGNYLDTAPESLTMLLED